MSPPLPWFTWPLEPGRQWSYRGTLQDPSGAVERTDTFIALGSEVVEVPAGRFTTLKIVHESDRGDRNEYWYAPDVRSYIKWVWRRGRPAARNSSASTSPRPVPSDAAGGEPRRGGRRPRASPRSTPPRAPAWPRSTRNPGAPSPRRSAGTRRYAGRGQNSPGTAPRSSARRQASRLRGRRPLRVGAPARTRRRPPPPSGPARATSSRSSPAARPARRRDGARRRPGRPPASSASAAATARVTTPMAPDSKQPERRDESRGVEQRLVVQARR